MSRITDAERGARIALEHAEAVLSLHTSTDLFPVRLSRSKRQFWGFIRDAALYELAECHALNAAIRQGEAP
ncbi:hypothetical protein [Xanthomonas sp. XNM01]|uniref:hypothetical protein n=1 Tax=Xanthomonas sp. XNM01 TaxID=2769289 RepID=UPI0017832E57|nr:hypothetical protein [Xanthomonas sp. XNM01]MBD9368354.1 hypothetical protein [Xanthomonas sp. XNM01]